MARFVRKRKDTKRQGHQPSRPPEDEKVATSESRSLGTGTQETESAASGAAVKDRAGSEAGEEVIEIGDEPDREAAVAVTEDADWAVADPVVSVAEPVWTAEAEAQASHAEAQASDAQPAALDAEREEPVVPEVEHEESVAPAVAHGPEAEPPDAAAGAARAVPSAPVAELAAVESQDSVIERAESDAEGASVGTSPGSDSALTAATPGTPRRRSRAKKRPSNKRPGTPPAAREAEAEAGRNDHVSESESTASTDGAGVEEPSAAQQDEERDERDERGRSQMLVHVEGDKIHVAILEGRTLVEHYVTHRSAHSIAGNIYLGKVQNVLPGMEAAFVDIGTSKNAVLYAGDVRYVSDEQNGKTPRIEDILLVGQAVLVQVVKDPMGSKGARLTTEISLPGRFLVLVPEDDSTGISRRISDQERTRLRDTLRRLRPDGFGVIVRTAAEQAMESQLKLDLDRLESLWYDIYKTATHANPPTVIYEEPELVIRAVREVFSAEFRRIIVDDTDVHARIAEYLTEFDPDLVGRVQFYDDELSVFRRYHVSEQIRQALSRKVWLPSGGSLVFDSGEALTVIDVNTAKNVGTNSLEQTVYENNLEAAEEIARQLRLRDIGGIIVIDFIDMEVKKNRDGVLKAFKQAVGRDKTKTQVYDISELGLVEMTRKNVSEGLLGSFSRVCADCQGTGYVIEDALLP